MYRNALGNVPSGIALFAADQLKILSRIAQSAGAWPGKGTC